MSPIVVLALLGAGWWFWAGPGRKKRGVSSMSRAEARRLLGLTVDADADEVRAAHRRIVARVHPDAGGSVELAARVNAARDVLLREIA